ncbi:unnamed protein product [Rotaria socialis]|uniref:Uncharacterized protein n=1 Tax=Rotaria socialis TaxID=392032 RepID=A0A818W5Z7_9BILA|nr:unnamed protein product [Rotaria socialis]CAF4818685.1 unnamed protein product [Rotaria socialis]
MFLIQLKIVLLILFVNSVQLCYSSCDQAVPFNSTLQPPTNCTALSNASFECSVSVTFSSIQDDHIRIFYFAYGAGQRRSSFVDTEVNLWTGIFTSDKIKCYEDDDEKVTIDACQSCPLDTNGTSTIRSCKNGINIVGAQLYEQTTLDDERKIAYVYVECIEPRCNARNTTQAALRIFSDTGFAQHYYGLPSLSSPSSAIFVSFSFTPSIMFMLAVVNVFRRELD